jgi:regulator of protease activity HflC (stomatin/prohibitin superfamily)
MRATTIDVPPVEVMTKGGVPLSVSAHVRARVVAPTDAVVRVVNYTEATAQLAQTALRASTTRFSRPTPSRANSS